MVRCACGVPEPEQFRPGYGRCARCGTLVFLGPYDADRYLKASDDPSSFYGRDYWEKRVPEVHGLPRLEERARTDLADRSLFFLEKILRYVEAGQSVLELGCAHGGLTFLLRRAGFEAAGLEMSPWLIAWARERFGIVVHRGPVEKLEPDMCFDAIVAIDVLEHLPDPLGTLRACRERLLPDGRVILQTPCYREEGPDWQMFLPDEHLFLFTADSVEKLLRRAGFDSVIVEPSLFAYDMWITAAVAGNLEVTIKPEVDLPPEIRALLDLRKNRIELANEAHLLRLECKNHDRELRRAADEIVELREDQAAKERLIRRIDVELKEVRADQELKQRRIEEDAGKLERARAELFSSEQLLRERDLESTRLRARRSELQEELRQMDRQAREHLETLGNQQALIRSQQAEVEKAGSDLSAMEELLRKRDEEDSRLRARQEDLVEDLRALGEELQQVRSDQRAKELLIREISRRFEEEGERREAAAQASLRWRSALEREEAARAALAREVEALASSYQALIEDRRDPSWSGEE